jgi:glucose/arabinose dehydrogenase
MVSPRAFAPGLASLTALAAAAGAFGQSPGPDPARGKVLFQQTCALCHSTGQPGSPAMGQGPLIAGVVGRRSASLPDFGYSKALEAAHLTWDAATLDRFLAGPGALVPGTAMVVVVPAAADRADLIAFLSTLPRVEAAVEPSAPGAHARTPGDWQNDAPGVRHRVRVEDLPAPFSTSSAGNGPKVVDRPEGAGLSVPKGFTVSLLLSHLSGPRLMRTAPNGDIFIAETSSGDIRVLRLSPAGDAVAENAVFASGLSGPFGVSFYPAGPDPRWVYVGNQNSVVRFPYRSGDLQAAGPAETIVARLTQSGGGHSTRDVVFSLDGTRMFISVGSGGNVADDMPRKSPAEIAAWELSHARGAAWENEENRADILVTDPEGRQPLRIYATGIRNPVGLAVQPGTGLVWASTNERDALGDDLVPDYVTHVTEGGFYGWPWYYMGCHEDPRHAGERPDLAGATLTPDVPEQAHSASLELSFYPADAAGTAAFPADYRGDIFVAFHGSWNRSGRTGSKVVRLLLKDGVATGAYEDFVTGFVVDDGHVWGRPVGVTFAKDGSLIFSDDAGGTLWRVAYTGAPAKP